MSEIGDTISTVLESDKRFSNFERVADRRWVSSPSDCIYKMFEFQALKGDQLSARWGWSIGFVPVLKGRKLASKRSATKAVLDLCIDPIDESAEIRNWHRFTRSDGVLTISRTSKSSLDAAYKDLRTINTLTELAAMFERRSTMRFQRFSLENYIQTDLAWGLLLISIGQPHDGKRHIDKFCDSFDIPRDLTALAKAEAQANLVFDGRRDIL